jgi:hypothetical protein
VALQLEVVCKESVARITVTESRPFQSFDVSTEEIHPPRYPRDGTILAHRHTATQHSKPISMPEQVAFIGLGAMGRGARPGIITPTQLHPALPDSNPTPQAWPPTCSAGWLQMSR